MLDENLIFTLKQTLSQTRNAQGRLKARLSEVEAESDRLKQEIEALEQSASQTKTAIVSLMDAIGVGDDDRELRMLRYGDESEVNKDYQRPYRQNQGQQNSNQGNYYGTNPISYINQPSVGRQTKNYPQQHIEPINNRFSDRTITQACTLLLRESGKPLHVNELYDYLRAGGMEFKGNNPTISIAVSLNRNRRFRKVAPGTFDLVMRDASQAAS